MKKKFTYSRKDKTRPRNKDSTPDDEDGSRKRRKTDSPSESSSFVSVPTISSTASSIRAKGSAIFKRTSQYFSGPISVPHDDAEIETTPKARKSLSGLFDKALQPRAQPQNSKQPNIHGSREDFLGAMQARKKEERNTQPSGSYLPTPPSEVQRLRSNGTGSSSNGTSSSSNGTSSSSNGTGGSSNSSGLGVRPNSTTTSTTYDGSSEAMDLCRKRSKTNPQKQPYVPKIYAAEKTAHSGGDLFGERLAKDSKEVHLWSTNQSKSPFLRLPQEVRARIYEYVLGGKTITIGYETYRTVESASEPRKVVPVFRYCCAIYSQRNVNPFKKQLPFINISRSYTPLDNICRQLYNETATLPYTLNTLAFSTHNTMFNFLFLEQRLSREQLDSITSITLHDALPMSNLLTFMRNLQKVELTDDLPGNSKGSYKVTRVKGKAPKLLNTRHVWGG